MLSVMSKRSYRLYQNLKSKNSEPTGIAISAHKRLEPALFVYQNIHTPHKATESARRGVARIHDPTRGGSWHAVLSPADCAEVIGKEWRKAATGCMVDSKEVV